MIRAMNKNMSKLIVGTAERIVIRHYAAYYISDSDNT